MPVRNKDEIGSKIISAFQGPHNNLRTIGGIARDTGLSYEIVNNYVTQHRDVFRQFDLSPAGIEIYELKNQITW